MGAQVTDGVAPIGKPTLSDLADAQASVNTLVTVALSQNQYDALVSFTFNLGGGALGGSTLLRILNSGDYAGAAAQFPVWDHVAGIVSAGLLARRRAEQAMFLAA